MRKTPGRNYPGWTPAMPDDTTIANDATRTLPPTHQPSPAKPPRGKAPRWPLAGRTSGRPRGSAYARGGRQYAPVAPPFSVRAPSRVSPGAPRVAAPDRRVYGIVRRYLPRFHPIHIILLAGVGAMWIAITQAWGSDAAGNPVFIQQFSIPRFPDSSVDIGQLALQTATFLAVGAVVMAVALLLVNGIHAVANRILRRIGFTAVASILFIPIVGLLVLLLLADLTLAAGFGGLGFLSQLPFVRDHGFASVGVAHAAIGFYLWWIGIGLTFIGTLGEIFIDRR